MHVGFTIRDTRQDPATACGSRHPILGRGTQVCTMLIAGLGKDPKTKLLLAKHRWLG